MKYDHFYNRRMCHCPLTSQPFPASGMLPALLLGAVLTSALAVPLLTTFLCRTSREAPATENQATIKDEVLFLLLFSTYHAHLDTSRIKFHFSLRCPITIQRLWSLSPRSLSLRSLSIPAISTCNSLKITSWLSPPPVPTAAVWNRHQEPALVSPA